MRPRVPDRDLVRLPRLIRPHRHRLGRHQRDIATTGGARVLCDRHRMQVHHPRFETAVFLGAWWGIGVFAFAGKRVIECPVLHIPLPSLHDRTADARVPRSLEGSDVLIREMQVLIRHHQLAIDPIKAHLTIAPLEGQRMRDRRHLAIDDPLVHAPEMRVMKFQPKLIDHPCDQWELLGRANGSAEAYRIVRRRLFPSTDVFQRLRAVELFQRLVEDDLESGAGKTKQRFRRESGGFINDRGVQRGVVPPGWGERTEFS